MFYKERNLHTMELIKTCMKQGFLYGYPHEPAPFKAGNSAMRQDLYLCSWLQVGWAAEKFGEEKIRLPFIKTRQLLLSSSENKYEMEELRIFRREKSRLKEDHNSYL